ncbi:MAG: Si-specific NAD(P)(+) transhydrogenase [Alphaproteobacteria bacterium]
MTYDYDLICIGSGPGGQRGAVQAAKLGKRVAIIEKQRDVGGDCLHTGTIPSKTFRESVLAFSRIANGLNSGTAYVRGVKSNGRGKPDAGELFGRVSNIVEREVSVMDDQLTRNDVEIIAGTASFADPHTLNIESEDGTRPITGENILVTVGTRPSPPATFSVDGQFVLTSDEIFKIEEIPRSVIVIGCGVIGIEYASMLAALGVNVTVVDGRQRPLEFLDHEIIDELVHQMRDKGVLFRLGETVESVNVKHNGRSTVVISLESGKRLAADLALICAGRVGATDTLNLDAAGLMADDRGRLTVDENFRTAVPHIYAAGDVIGYPSLAATSSEQGRLAACAAFGVNAKPMSKHFPIGVYSVPEVSMVGAPEHELTEQKVPYETGVARFREIARGHILGDKTGFLKMTFHREDRRLLGVHAIGTGATELIHIGQCAYGLGGGLDYFLETVSNYPTLAECYKVAALDAHNKLLL